MIGGWKEIMVDWMVEGAYIGYSHSLALLQKRTVVKRKGSTTMGDKRSKMGQ